MKWEQNLTAFKNLGMQALAFDALLMQVLIVVTNHFRHIWQCMQATPPLGT